MRRRKHSVLTIGEILLETRSRVDLAMESHNEMLLQALDRIHRAVLRLGSAEFVKRTERLVRARQRAAKALETKRHKERR